jgi:hypothetical protein
VFVAAAVGIEEFLGAGRRWRNYRSVVEVLKAEDGRYVALAGKWPNYGSHKEAFREFADSMCSALLEETEQYVRAVAPEPATGTRAGRKRRS